MADYCILFLLSLGRFSEGILINISSNKNPFVGGFTLTISHFVTEKNAVVPGTRAVWNWAIGGVNLLMRDYIVNQLLNIWLWWQTKLVVKTFVFNTFEPSIFMTSVHPPPPHASRPCVVMWQYTGTFVDPTSSKYAVSFGPGQTCHQKAKFIQNDIATVALFLVEWTSFLRNLANFELHVVFFAIGIRKLFWSRVLIAWTFRNVVAANQLRRS